MECNICLTDVGEFRVTYRAVTFTMAHCRCGKVRREVKTSLATREDIEQELSELHAAVVNGTAELRKQAIEYLERMLLSITPRSTHQKRHDLWQRKFLKEALGDDYYS